MRFCYVDATAVHSNLVQTVRVATCVPLRQESGFSCCAIEILEYAFCDQSVASSDNDRQP